MSLADDLQSSPKLRRHADAERREASAARCAEALALFEGGMSYAEIAKHYGATIRRVGRWLFRARRRRRA